MRTEVQQISEVSVEGQTPDTKFIPLCPNYDVFPERFKHCQMVIPRCIENSITQTLAVQAYIYLQHITNKCTKYLILYLFICQALQCSHIFLRPCSNYIILFLHLLLSVQSSSISPFSPIIPLIPSAQASLGPPRFLLPDGRHFSTFFGSCQSSIGRLARWWIGECSPDIEGTGEIKYPGRTKTSTAALEFDTGVSKARGRKP